MWGDVRIARASRCRLRGAGHAIGIARPGARGSARHYFLRAREECLIALQALAADGDRVLEGEVALALAGIEYLQFVNWMRTAD